VQITSSLRTGLHAQRAERGVGGLLSEHRHALGTQCDALAVAKRVVKALSKREAAVNVKDHGQLGRELPSLPSDWGQLIQKLRWIGLDEEAERLELAISKVPPDERRDLFLAPLETD